MGLPITLEKLLIFILLQCVQLVKVLVLKSVFVRPVLCGDQSLLDQRFGILGLFGNNAMLTEDIVPIQCGQHTAFGLYLAGGGGMGMRK